MGTQEIKWNVLQKLMQVENRELLEKLDQLLNQEMIVGYTTDGRPLTKEAYDQRLALAEEQIASGRMLSQEDVEREIENW